MLNRMVNIETTVLQRDKELAVAWRKETDTNRFISNETG